MKLLHPRQIRPILILPILLTLIALQLTNCSGDKEDGWNPFLSHNGTGVRGLDTPDQILKNPYVEDALNEAEDKGVNISPEKDIHPPVISGTYGMSGEAYNSASGWYQLNPGTWKWFNQTANNYIDTDYDQGFQTGGGVEGEIIRGKGNRFTVYSILDVDDEAHGGCKERAVAIIDGTQKYNGDIEAVYMITPAQEGGCHVTTFGYLELDLTGSAKSNPNEVGAAFMRLIKDDLNISTEQKIKGAIK